MNYFQELLRERDQAESSRLVDTGAQVTIEFKKGFSLKGFFLADTHPPNTIYVFWNIFLKYRLL